MIQGLQIIQHPLLEQIYSEAKFWLIVIGGIWTIFKSYNKAETWFKTLKENDLHHIHLGVQNLHTELTGQTTAVVKALEAQTNELKELRQDMRAYRIPSVKVARARRKRS